MFTKIVATKIFFSEILDDEVNPDYIFRDPRKRCFGKTQINYSIKDIKVSKQASLRVPDHVL